MIYEGVPHYGLLVRETTGHRWISLIEWQRRENAEELVFHPSHNDAIWRHRSGPKCVLDTKLLPPIRPVVDNFTETALEITHCKVSLRCSGISLHRHESSFTIVVAMGCFKTDLCLLCLLAIVLQFVRLVTLYIDDFPFGSQILFLVVTLLHFF